MASISTIPGEVPVLVYSNYVDESGLAKVLPALAAQLGHDRIGTLTGKTSDVGDVMERFKRGDLDVMLLSEAGATGHDYVRADDRGVRHIHVLDPLWVYMRFKQLVGRGARYRSHMGWPPAQRTLDVFRLRFIRLLAFLGT